MDGDDTAVTVTIRLIKSFTHRNIKHVVFKAVPLRTTVKDFKASILQGTIIMLFHGYRCVGIFKIQIFFDHMSHA